MSELDNEMLSRLGARLRARREALDQLEQTGSEAAGTVELDQTRQGRLSRMDALQHQAMSKEAKRRRETELQLIAAALKRLDQGDYGLCVRCGEPIALQRLELDPATPLCIDCASQSDSRP